MIERPGACPGEARHRCFVLFHVAKHGTLTPAANCIGVAVSPAPEGPYQELGPLAFPGGAVDASGRPPGCGDDGGYSNIDPAPFVDSGGDGTAYLYLSTGHRCQTPAPHASCPFDRTISVIELAPDLLSAAGPRQELFNGATPGWEVAPFGTVVENPWPVRTAGGYMLMYSGGAYDGPYGMGYATSSSPTSGFVKSADNPVLREREGVLSPGGGMVVTGPKGGTWLAYHGRQGAYENPRELRIDPVRFPSPSSVASTGPPARPSPPLPRTVAPGPARPRPRPHPRRPPARGSPGPRRSGCTPGRGSATTLPHSGHARSGVARSLRLTSAAIVPKNGRQKPMRNQRKNEPPLSFAITAADRPKKKRMTMNSTRSARVRGRAWPR